MAWEYLTTKQFDERYKIAGEFLKNKVKDKIVLDVNCGEPRFKNYITGYNKYIAIDINKPHDIAGISFIQVKDENIDIKSDILTLFGYGGGEYTGEPLESHTILNTIIRLSRHKPKYIVIEMVQKWEEDFKAKTKFLKELENYEEILFKKIEVNPITHYHNKRQISILQLTKNL